MVVDKNVWELFGQRYGLSVLQLKQFVEYSSLLIEWNKRINLTAITDETDIIAYHFEDSLKLADFYDFSHCSIMADIGTGAGFPGIPLKIMFPHLSVVLVEVVQKKVSFLEMVIKELGLSDIQVCPLDWRTFLRQTNFPVQLVCARASLRPDELIRMFQSSSPYRNAQLVYWASQDHVLGAKEQSFLLKKCDYVVGKRHRIYIFLNSPE